MILYEHEGKELLAGLGFAVPEGQTISSLKNKIALSPPFFLKAQTLSGKRKGAGGILEVTKPSEVVSALSRILGSAVNGERVEKVLIEKKVPHKEEYYLSISYDTKVRGPVLTFSRAGGTGIEERKVATYQIDPVSYALSSPKSAKIPQTILKAIPRLIELFFSSDLLLLEINPLVVDEKGRAVALDAKIKLDDSAFGRHPEWNYPPRAVSGHTPTEREIAAKKIDEGDYRGTAGSTYFDLEGDIAILASGGGASLTAMDALLAAGGRPANYTEYSGNPSKEKVAKLTKIVLERKNLGGLWIVGAVANFTDIYETLSGIIEAIKKVKPKPIYPIVIRRGGPRDKEAFGMLKEIKDLNLHVYGSEISITESARVMVDSAKKHASLI